MSAISELFDKDPLSYTKEDITAVVAYFREMRLKFKLGDKTAGSPKKMSSPEKGKADLTALELDL